MNKVLPERATLEQLKNQAKDLFKNIKSNDALAVERVIRIHSRLDAAKVAAAKWKLTDAQYILAKEYGYKSWERLKTELEKRKNDRFNIRRIIPLIPVSNMQKSLEFYEEVLGFHRVGHAMNENRLYWCRLKREGTQVMLEEGKTDFVVSADPIKLCFITKDVDRVYAQLVGNGFPIKRPSTAPYGMRQIFLKDPDGHVIWFESPIGERDFEDYTE